MTYCSILKKSVLFSISILLVSIQTLEAYELSSKKAKYISTTISTTLSTDTQDIAALSKSYNSEFEITPRFVLGSDILSLRFQFEKELSQGRNSSLGNTTLGWSRANLWSNNDLSLSTSVSVVLPTSKKSSILDGLYNTLEFSMVFKYLVLDNFSLTYIPRISKNFHRYTTSFLNEKNNVNYRVLQILSGDYQLTDKLNAGVTLIYVDSWSYYGTQRDDSYLTISQASYNLNSQISVALGVMTGGAVYNTQRGPDQRVELFDQNTSSYFTSLEYVF